MFNTNPMNIFVAIQRQKHVEASGSSQWALFIQKQWVDYLDEITISYMIDWWRSEARINPNRIDVTRKHIATKVYEKHATHLLLETQVRNT